MSAFTRVGETFRSIGRWIQTHRVPSLIAVGVLLVAIASGIAYVLVTQPLPKLDTTPIAVKPRPPAPKYYSLLDGTQIPDPAAAAAPVTAIMIENSPSARPQSGLKQAQVVYEAIAEGGITRFLAVYQQNKPGLIGPVRSLRMYYLDWAAPYQPSIVHVGGSLYALQQVRSGDYRNVDIEYHAGASWRATDRAAPHNVYTNFQNLEALNNKLGYTSSTFTSFARADGKPAATQDAKSIDVAISGALYNSHYDYNPATNTYARSQAGAPHLDREDGQITPSVIVTLKVNMTTIMEDGWRENITTTGSGEAQIFQNGTVQTATWSKADRTSPLQLTGADGKEVALNRGQTWVAAVPTTAKGVSWQ